MSWLYTPYSWDAGIYGMHRSTFSVFIVHSRNKHPLLLLHWRHIFFFFTSKQVWVEFPLCTASVTDRKAHSCILIWSFTEHMERIEKPSSSLLKPMVHCAVIWYIITERSCFMLYMCIFSTWIFEHDTFTLKSNLLLSKEYVFKLQIAGQVQDRWLPAAVPVILSPSILFLSNQPSPSSVSYLSLNREVILSQVITLPCFYLSCLSSHISSCTLPLFLLMPLSSPQLYTWPNHFTDTKFRSLYPPLSALALQLVCVTECSASAYSHWQLARAGGEGEDGEGRQGEGGMRGGRERQRDRPLPPGISPRLFLRKCRWCRFDAAYIMQRSEAVRVPSGPVLPRLPGRNWARRCHLLKASYISQSHYWKL